MSNPLNLIQSILVQTSETIESTTTGATSDNRVHLVILLVLSLLVQLPVVLIVVDNLLPSRIQNERESTNVTLNSGDLSHRQPPDLAIKLILWYYDR